MLCGTDGAERLEATARGSGPAAWLTRVLRAFGGDQQEIREDEQEISAGHFLVRVPAESSEERERARDVLRDLGGRRMRHHGRNTIEHLTP